jgi:hypothetical protein
LYGALLKKENKKVLEVLKSEAVQVKCGNIKSIVFNMLM